ncbi:hypothetical protein INT45_008339 [Circinella minor]|uniref:Uncharacterized protein n=1 Tax=Circinella minor TaxID=1195481 RepID=A0A8H7VIG0_9FUNG|nr:hypothetical protein INT45_008339 [Circinella minor]
MTKNSNFITAKNNHAAFAYNDINRKNEKSNQQGAAIAMGFQERSDTTIESSTFLQNITSEDKCNLSSSLEIAKLFNQRYCYTTCEHGHNRRRSNNDSNKRISQSQPLKNQQRSKKKKFFIANDSDDDSDNDENAVDQCYFDGNCSSSAIAISSNSLKSYSLLKDDEYYYNCNSCCSSSDDDYFDPLPTPTNADIITNTTSTTSFTSTTTTSLLSYIETTTNKEPHLSLMTRFVPDSIESNVNNNNQTVSSISTVNHKSLYPSPLLRRCNTKYYSGLDEWFAARLHG